MVDSGGSFLASYNTFRKFTTDSLFKGRGSAIALPVGVLPSSKNFRLPMGGLVNH
jgi:hypothetical protein